jgi:hypothetical protein
MTAECVARGRCCDRSLLYSLALCLQTEQQAGACSFTHPVSPYTGVLVLSIETLVRMHVNKRMHAEPLHPTVASGRLLPA